MGIGGSQQFAERMLRLAGKVVGRQKSRVYRPAAERQAHRRMQTERRLAEGLAAAGLTAEMLPGLKGRHARKAALAGVLRRRTTADMNWIAQSLRMRSAPNVGQQLPRARSQPTEVGRQGCKTDQSVRRCSLTPSSRLRSCFPA